MLKKVYALVKASAGLIISNVVLSTKCGNFNVFRLNQINVFVTLTKVICLLFFSSELLPRIQGSAMNSRRKRTSTSSFRHIRTIVNTHFPNVGGEIKSFGFIHRCNTRMGRVGQDKIDVMRGLSQIGFRRKSALIL